MRPMFQKPPFPFLRRKFSLRWTQRIFGRLLKKDRRNYICVISSVFLPVGYSLIGATSGWSFQSTVKQPSLYLSVSPKHPQKWFGFPRRSPIWSVSDCHHTVLFIYVKNYSPPKSQKSIRFFHKIFMFFSSTQLISIPRFTPLPMRI